MAQYCEIASRTTNCTENCKVCLEEETEVLEIKVGDKVRYITEDTDFKKKTGFYPPKGTIGTVLKVEVIGNLTEYHVKWTEGTTAFDGCWCARKQDIESV